MLFIVLLIQRRRDGAEPAPSRRGRDVSAPHIRIFLICFSMIPWDDESKNKNKKKKRNNLKQSRRPGKGKERRNGEEGHSEAMQMIFLSVVKDKLLQSSFKDHPSIPSSIHPSGSAVDHSLEPRAQVIPWLFFSFHLSPLRSLHSASHPHTHPSFQVEDGEQTQQQQLFCLRCFPCTRTMAGGLRSRDQKTDGWRDL